MKFPNLLINAITVILFFCPIKTLPQIEADTSSVAKQKAVRVFIDCQDCDYNYIRSEITFVNYVRERLEAQVHILITTQSTASGGDEYTLTFIGQNEFKGIDDTLTYVSKNDETDDSIRKGLVKIMKIGLVRYVSKTPLYEDLEISYREPTKQEEVVDKWDYWVFSTNVNSYFNGQKSQSFIAIYGGFSANRITNDWKVRLSLNSSYNENRYEFFNRNFLSASRSYGFYSFIAKGIDDHWSAGISGSLSSASYSNINLSIGLGPTVEYNIFPYSEYTRRELRLKYGINAGHTKYREETIYDKKYQTLFSQSLSATLEFNQPWGSTETTLSGSQYFHDLNKYQLTLYSEFNLRLIAGLSFRFYGRVAMIRNQIGLPKQDASMEEVLLQRRELETQYDYYGSVGLSYTFGSIYSNIVNPRFGN